MRYLMLLMLVGCATRFTHPTKSDLDFHTDAFDCERIAAATYPGPNWSDEISRGELGKRCMMARGWVPD